MCPTNQRLEQVMDQLQRNENPRVIGVAVRSALS